MLFVSINIYLLNVQALPELQKCLQTYIKFFNRKITQRSDGKFKRVS
ncbi:hypothetical protein NIASO_18260 [Niabella soli DSM 19437]|uniref:Uncharacterized protein n=1 Tax=Niabella soli DSM 19437 TaxID=929713 RepID=W0F844_9BACT|nr:hypothetical protein NIASO_18260 [Niabella soli DSM 19437]